MKEIAYANRLLNLKDSRFLREDEGVGTVDFKETMKENEKYVLIKTIADMMEGFLGMEGTLPFKVLLVVVIKST